MTWFLSILVLVILILFVLTWFNISQRADADDHRALKRKYDDTDDFVSALRKQHNGYGPLNQHMAALDQIVTLVHQPSGKNGGNVMQIPTPEMYKVGYAMYGEGKQQSIERSITLRELLNRLLIDVPAELIHKVDEDFNFKKPAPPLINFIAPPYVLDNRPHPLDTYHTPASGCGVAYGPLGFVPKPVVFSPHSCGLDVGSASGDFTSFDLFNDKN